jgi:hypothetical protein
MPIAGKRISDDAELALPPSRVSFVTGTPSVPPFSTAGLTSFAVRQYVELIWSSHTVLLPFEPYLINVVHSVHGECQSLVINSESEHQDRDPGVFVLMLSLWYLGGAHRYSNRSR